VKLSEQVRWNAWSVIWSAAGLMPVHRRLKASRSVPGAQRGDAGGWGGGAPADFELAGPGELDLELLRGSPD
jgi:hypothetical protein